MSEMSKRIPKINASVFVFLLLAMSSGAEQITHILQKGETLYALSRKYHVSPELIMSANGIQNADKLRAGQKIIIPDSYVAQKGDTLYGIARKFGVSVSELQAANRFSQDYSLKAGDTLFLPAQANASPASVITQPSVTASAAPSQKTGVPSGEKNAATKEIEDPRAYDKKNVDSSIIWPVSVKDIAYLSGKVYGVSITSAIGEKVKAINSGTILSVGPYRGFGQVAFLQSKGGYIYVYGGLSAINAKPGQLLAFGDEIGVLGTDSLSGTPRLYFMVYNKDKPVDPAKAPRGY